MSVSYSPSMRYWEGTPGTPDVKNVWGAALDTNFTLIDQSFNVASLIDITGLTAYSLTTANAAPDQARQAVLPFTGVLTAACAVTLPNVPRVGWVVNATTGGFNVTLTAGAGTTGILPPDGVYRLYIADGSGNVSIPNLSVTGAVTGTSLSITGSAFIQGTLLADGGINSALGLAAPLLNVNTATVNQNLTVGGSITASGVTANSARINSALNVVFLQDFAGYAVNVNSVPAPAQNFTCYGGNIATLGSVYAAWLFGGAAVGSITTGNGTSVSYNTTSDQRLKNNVGSIADVGRLIDRLKPRWFTWRSDPDADPEPGFFAQEVHRVWHWAVTKGRGRIGNKNFVPWQIDNAKLVPLLVAELQELRLRVASLEKRA